MARNPSGNPSSRKNEIVIASIGLVGIVVTGVLSNWDKIFPQKNIVQSSYSGYSPTGDPKIELRYFAEITGMRDILRGMQKQMLGPLEKQLESQFRDKPEISSEFMKVMDEELAIQYDQIMNTYVSIASKYYSVAMLQQLNKFYSTPEMREMMRITSLVSNEFTPQAMTIVSGSEERLKPKLDMVLSKYGQ